MAIGHSQSNNFMVYERFLGEHFLSLVDQKLHIQIIGLAPRQKPALIWANSTMDLPNRRNHLGLRHIIQQVVRSSGDYFPLAAYPTRIKPTDDDDCECELNELYESDGVNPFTTECIAGCSLSPTVSIFFSGIWNTQLYNSDVRPEMPCLPCCRPSEQQRRARPPLQAGAEFDRKQGLGCQLQASNNCCRVGEPTRGQWSLGTVAIQRLMGTNLDVKSKTICLILQGKQGNNIAHKQKHKYLQVLQHKKFQYIFKVFYKAFN